jgi:hypothetical protein
MAPYRKYQERCTHEEESVDFPSAVTALLRGSIATPSHPTLQLHLAVDDWPPLRLRGLLFTTLSTWQLSKKKLGNLRTRGLF